MFRSLKVGRNFVLGIRVFSFFFFVFHAKSRTTNNHLTGLSEISG